MAIYIEANVHYDKIMENGRQKRVSEPYLVDALSCTEAEACVTEEVTPYIDGEFTVSAIKKTNIAEVFRNEGDWWYRVKINILTIDEKTGAEKKNPFYYLVQANDFEEALSNFNKEMKNTITDYEITAIIETKIMDVFDAKQYGLQN